MGAHSSEKRPRWGCSCFWPFSLLPWRFHLGALYPSAAADLNLVVVQEGGHHQTTPELGLSLQLAQLALLEASTKLSPLPMQLVASLENNAPGPCSTWAFFLSSSQTSWVEMNWNTSVFPQYHCCYQLPGPQYHCCYQFIHTK